jgi:hypothetical protein
MVTKFTQFSTACFRTESQDHAANVATLAMLALKNTHKENHKRHNLRNGEDICDYSS